MGSKNMKKSVLIIKNGDIEIQINPYKFTLINSKIPIFVGETGCIYPDLLDLISMLVEEYFDTEHLQCLIAAYINDYVEEYINQHIDNMTENNFVVEYLTIEEYKNKIDESNA